ncbi:MAG: AN1-type zinc finger domain-containing protein [Candidatus Bathyarchaeota archaeon]
MKKNNICRICRKEVYPLPYRCNYCGDTFCADHRLPEKHNCEKIKEAIKTQKQVHLEDLVKEIAEFEIASKSNSEGFLKKLGKKLRFIKG